MIKELFQNSAPSYGLRCLILAQMLFIGTARGDDEIVRDSAIVQGGGIRQCTLPQGIEDLDWESNSMEFLYLVMRGVEGDPQSVELRTELQGDKTWQQEFARRITGCFKLWKWYPTTEEGKPLEIGIYMTVRMERNNRGEIRIIIMSNLSNVVVDTFPGFSPG